MSYTHTYVSQEHLDKWRQSLAMKNAVALNPRAFTPSEIAEIEMGYYRVAQFIIEEYEIDEEESWMVSLFTGRIVYQDT